MPPSHTSGALKSLALLKPPCIQDRPQALKSFGTVKKSWDFVRVMDFSKSQPLREPFLECSPNEPKKVSGCFWAFGFSTSGCSDWFIEILPKHYFVGSGRGGTSVLYGTTQRQEAVCPPPRCQSPYGAACSRVESQAENPVWRSVCDM